DVPATRLPLDRLPQASGEPHVVPEVARARGDERRQRKEPALDRIQDHSVGRHGHAPQPLGGGGEAREPICSSPVRRPTPGDARPPYCPYRPSATSNPSTTCPMGAKPSASSRRLSARFTNSCVVRVFGPALAKVTVPRRLGWRTGSSGMSCDDQDRPSCGSA